MTKQFFKKNKTKLVILLVGFFILSLAAYLRFYKLASLPPAPYWEEVALGYDSYSVVQTGRDHHGHFLPLIAFESFGDWKPSGYFYVLAPFIKIFGLTVWAVRLPSAIAGMFIVIGVGLLTHLLVVQIDSLKYLRQQWGKQFGWWVGLSASLIAAVSLWAVMFSRAAWEANLATSLILWGVISFCFFQRHYSSHKKVAFIWLMSSVGLFAYSLYTYHAARVIAPLLLMILFAEFIYQQLKLKKNQATHGLVSLKKISAALTVISFAGLIFLSLMSPLLINLRRKEVADRFNTTSVFNDLQVIEQSNRLKQEAGNSLAARIFYHRDVFFARAILGRFLKHFQLDFLFIHGDKNPRHSLGFMGQLYYLDFFFILIASYSLIRWQKRIALFLFSWLILSIIPSSLTLKGAPHALRILPSLPVWLILISFGWLFLLNWLGKRTSRFWFNCLVVFLLLIYSIQVAMFWRFYTRIYPVIHSQSWQYGYRQMIGDVRQLEHQYPNYPVFISRSQGRPAMYYWFYTKTDPRRVQAREKIEKKSDLQNEFLTYRNKTFFDKSAVVSSPSIVALTPKELSQSSWQKQFQLITQVDNLAHQPIWLVGVKK